MFDYLDFSFLKSSMDSFWIDPAIKLLLREKAYMYVIGDCNKENYKRINDEIHNTMLKHCTMNVSDVRYQMMHLDNCRYFRSLEPKFYLLKFLYCYIKKNLDVNALDFFSCFDHPFKVSNFFVSET